MTGLRLGVVAMDTAEICPYLSIFLLCFFLLIYVNISSRFQIICTLTLIILTWKTPI